MYKYILFLVMVTSFANVGFAEVQMDIGGSARVRWESFDNVSDSNKTTDDKVDFTGSRFRLDFTAKVNPNVKVFVQPQFTKIFGGEEVIGATVDGVPVPVRSGQSSGNFNNTYLGVFSAYIQYTLKDSWDIWIGRQGLNYGDERVIGTVGWRNDSRAFDGLRVRKTYSDGKSWTDLLFLQLQEQNGGIYGGATTLGPDNEVSGVYTHLEDLGPMDADVYVLYSTDKGVTAPNKNAFGTYGTLLKANLGELDLGLEAAAQSGYDSSSIDFEAGYKFSGLRLFAGYAAAHKNYQQLYPTAHKFLGDADIFGRRNINAIRAGVKAKVNDEMFAKVQYNSFSRNDDKAPAYNLGGSGAIGTGAEGGSALANEVDFSWKWNFVEGAHILVGGAYVMPGEYLKNVRGKDDPGLFSYVQTGTTF